MRHFDIKVMCMCTQWPTVTVTVTVTVTTSVDHLNSPDPGVLLCQYFWVSQNALIVSSPA